MNRKIIFSLCAVIFASCSKLSFNDPPKKFFEYNTETASIGRYEIMSKNYIKGEGDTYYVASSEDFSVKFYLRNPQMFVFERGKNLVLAQNCGQAALENFAAQMGLSPVPEYAASIAQDLSDSYKATLILTFPKDYLYKMETGGDITPLISLGHPVSGAQFEQYNGITLICNTPPFAPQGTVVYQDDSTKKYIVAFNMPSKSLLSGIHRDINEIEIEIFDHNNNLISSERCDVLLQGDGSFAFGAPNSAHFEHGDISAKNYIPVSVPFAVAGQPAMYFTEVASTDQDTFYKITLRDKIGLETSIMTGARSTRLEPLSVYDINGNLIESLALTELEQDEGSSYATLRLVPADKAFAGGIEQASGLSAKSTVVYEIYSGSDDSGMCIATGTETGETFVQIPGGEIYARVYTQYAGFADSVPLEYKLNVAKTSVFVSAEGSDENPGSKNLPYKTLGAALLGFGNIANHGNNVTLLTDLSENVENNSAAAVYKIVGDAGVARKITGNLNLSGKSVALKDLTIDGNINFAGEELILQNVAVSGKISLLQDGAKISLGGNTNAGLIELGGAGQKIALDSLQADSIKVGVASGVQANYGLNCVLAVGKTESDITKIKLQSEEYYIKAQAAAAGFEGVLAKPSAGGSLELPFDEYTFTLKKQDGTVVERGDTVIGGDILSFEVRDSDGNEIAIPSEASYKIALMHGGAELQNYSSENDSLASTKITVPEKLAGMTIDVYMSVVVDGIAYDTIVPIKIEKQGFTLSTSGGITTITASSILTGDELAEIAQLTKTSDTLIELDLSACSITNMNSASYWMYGKLKSIVLPDGVASIGSQLFQSATALESIVVADSNANYKTVDGVLYNKDMTKIVRYPPNKEGTSFTTLPSTVTSAAYGAFEDTTKLERVDGFEQVTAIDSMNCFAYSGIKTITLSPSLANIPSYTFQYSKLERITIPTGVSSIGFDAFYHCEELKEVIVERSSPPTFSVGNGRTVFQECTDSDFKIKVPANSVDAYQNAENWSAVKGKIEANN